LNNEEKEKYEENDPVIPTDDELIVLDSDFEERECRIGTNIICFYLGSITAVCMTYRFILSGRNSFTAHMRTVHNVGIDLLPTLFNTWVAHFTQPPVRVNHVLLETHERIETRLVLC